MIVRHLLSILLLPSMVIVVIPYWIIADNPNTAGASSWFLQVAGVALFIAAFALFAWCLALFARLGQGTLAPWDPTRKMVAAGPYALVRNPMISAVVLMLFGEALFFNHMALYSWALAFLVINHVYFIFSEEPGLEKRFGESYRLYKARVPRWLPKVHL